MGRAFLERKDNDSLEGNLASPGDGLGKPFASARQTDPPCSLGRGIDLVRRCVFIHDPRISGPNDAYLYSVNDHKSGSGRGGGGVGSPFGRDTFYWPDMPRTNGDNKSVRSAEPRARGQQY